MRPILIYIACFVLFCVPAVADDDLTGDRPDLTESATTVGHLRFQLETGFAYERTDHSGVEETVLSNPTLLRFGIGDTLELRLESDSVTYSENTRSPDNYTGISPVALGMKLNIADRAASGGFTLGVLAAVEIPSGSDQFKSDDYAYTVKLLGELQLTDSIGLASNFGFDNSVDELGERFTSFTLTTALGFELSSTLGAFTELALETRDWSEGEEQLLFDAGLTYLVSNGLQLDLAVGTGAIGERAPDFFLTTGIIAKF